MTRKAFRMHLISTEIPIVNADFNFQFCIPPHFTYKMIACVLWPCAQGGSTFALTTPLYRSILPKAFHRVPFVRLSTKRKSMIGVYSVYVKGGWGLGGVTTLICCCFFSAYTYCKNQVLIFLWGCLLKGASQHTHCVNLLLIFFWVLGRQPWFGGRGQLVH